MLATKPKIRLPYPHAGQMKVRQAARRFNWLSAGRRWRKTTLLMSIMVEAAIQGGTYIWGAPTFDQVRIGFNETRRAAGGVADFNLSRMTAVFPPHGGQIVYRSLDNPDNARGYTADGVGIDEAGDVKAEAWYEVLRPMLIDTDGWAWAIGTPKGQNWFYREHVNAFDRDDSACWQIPTLGVRMDGGQLIRDPHPLENPHIAFSEIEHIYNTVPLRTFQQEVLAQFLSGEGAVFRNIPANLIPAHDHAAGYWHDGAAHDGHRLVGGLDWAKQNDFTCLSIGCIDCGREVALTRFNQIDYHVQYQRVETMHQRYPMQAILAELNSIGEPNFEALQRAGLPVRGFQTTASSKPPLIENLVLTLEREEFQFLDVPVATAELEAYERKVSSTTGRSSYSAPDGMNDDTVMGRALMRQMAGQSWFTW